MTNSAINSIHITLADSITRYIDGLYSILHDQIKVPRSPLSEEKAA